MNSTIPGTNINTKYLIFLYQLQCNVMFSGNWWKEHKEKIFLRFLIIFYVLSKSLKLPRQSKPVCLRQLWKKNSCFLFPTMWNSRSLCGAESVALLDQLTSFGQRESLTIHGSCGSGRMSAVSSAQSVEMLQFVAARWRCSKWFWNQKFQGGHPSNYLWSQTLLNFNDYVTGSHIDL